VTATNDSYTEDVSCSYTNQLVFERLSTVDLLEFCVFVECLQFKVWCDLYVNKTSYTVATKYKKLEAPYIMNVSYERPEGSFEIQDSKFEIWYLKFEIQYLIQPIKRNLLN
jgi:hypothetical protein